MDIDKYMEDLKAQYTEAVKRAEKAEKWFVAPERTEEEREKFIGEFNKILDQIIVLTEKLDKYGLLTPEKVLRGF